MAISKSNLKLRLGDVYLTRGVAAKIPPVFVLFALERHMHGDWGDVCKADWELNDQAVKDGTRLVSIYKSKTQRTFWVITEADRSVTTVLMPEEY